MKFHGTGHQNERNEGYMLYENLPEQLVNILLSHRKRKTEGNTKG